MNTPDSDEGTPTLIPVFCFFAFMFFCTFVAAKQECDNAKITGTPCVQYLLRVPDSPMGVGD